MRVAGRQAVAERGLPAAREMSSSMSVRRAARQQCTADIPNGARGSTQRPSVAPLMSTTSLLTALVRGTGSAAPLKAGFADAAAKGTDTYGTLAEASTD